jgi:hypothetical protein
MGEGVRRAAAAAGVVATVIAAQALTNRAAAQDWSLSSSISQSGGYNSNLLLRPDNKLSTFSTVTKPQLKLERDSETSSVALSGTFKFAQYFDHSDLNADSELVNLNATKLLSERSQLGFNGDFNRDTTLGSDEDITGKFLTKQIRFRQWDASPSWSYALSPIDQLTLTGSYLSKDYDSLQKVDYQYYGGDTEYSHQLSELAAITGSISYFRYDADNPPQNTTNDIYGALIGYKYAPSERFYASGSVGADYNVTKSDNPHQDRGDVGYRLKLDLGYQMTDQTKARFLLSHDTEPSGDGTQVTRTRGTLQLSYALSELTTLALDANYVDNDNYFGERTSRTTEGLTRYYALKPSLTWNITEDLSLSASYQFRYKTLQSQGNAIDNGAIVTLRYGFPDLHWTGF